MAYQRVEVLTGSERRRTYTLAEKLRLVDEAFRPGVVVKQAARRLGVHESLLYRWRSQLAGTDTALADPPAFIPVTLMPEPTGPEIPVMNTAEPVLSAVAPVIVDVTLSSGARVRLEGPVDPALATAIIGALA